ncbi:MAG: DNA polymerase III subunit beta [Mailhella sp.]|nr:DNA polymerase III subunit beta [Mailhella sp.]
MKIIIKKEQIIEGLQKASSIIASKAGAPYLRTIWMKTEGKDRLTVMASDLNVEFTGNYPASVAEEGLAGVNGKSFVELIRRMPEGDITITADDAEHVLHIEQKRLHYKLPVSDPMWFNALAPFPEEGAVLWAGDFFKEIIDRVSFCIANDDTTEALNCLYMRKNSAGKVDVCGLEGHQFALFAFINDGLADKITEKGLLVQKKYVQEIRKWLSDDEIMLNVTERKLYLRNSQGTESISVPCSFFEYPDYANFLKALDGDDVSVMRADKNLFAQILDRIHVLSSTETDFAAIFSFSEGQEGAGTLKISAQGTSTGAEDIDVHYKGGLKSIAFPPKEFSEILGHFQSSELQFTFSGQNGPCGIKGADDPEYLVLIMPMTLPSESYYE